jgi:hypothetical protein
MEVRKFDLSTFLVQSVGYFVIVVWCHFVLNHDPKLPFFIKMQQRSREPYKWWTPKTYQSKATGISSPVANQGITAVSTATGIGQDEAPISHSAPAVPI